MAVYTILWEFAVDESSVEAFIAAYGASGDWARLFGQARGYRGTTLLRDEADPLRFVTIDRWESSEDFLRFQEEFGNAYAELDVRFERLTQSEKLIGRFSAEC